MSETHTYRVNGEGDSTWHIPGVHNGQITLCGFVDVAYEEASYKDQPCNCTDCITTLRKIQALKFPKGYFNA